MAEDTAKADACKEYQSSLEDLTFNSKPHINNLTILAEENLKYSPEIVKLIEAQISKAVFEYGSVCFLEPETVQPQFG